MRQRVEQPAVPPTFVASRRYALIGLVVVALSPGCTCREPLPFAEGLGSGSDAGGGSDGDTDAGGMDVTTRRPVKLDRDRLRDELPLGDLLGVYLKYHQLLNARLMRFDDSMCKGGTKDLASGLKAFGELTQRSPGRALGQLKGELEAPPLHHAAFFCQPRLIDLLLRHGAALEAKDGCGNRPLHTASWFGLSFNRQPASSTRLEGCAPSRVGPRADAGSGHGSAFGAEEVPPWLRLLGLTAEKLAEALALLSDRFDVAGELRALGANARARNAVGSTPQVRSSGGWDD